MNHSLSAPNRRAKRRDERGQAMVEYALIIVLIAVVAAVMLLVVGHTANNFYSNVSNTLSRT